MRLVQGQAWMFVDQLARQFGQDSVQRLLGLATQGHSLGAAFEQATGLSLDEWDVLWQRAASTGGVPEDWIDIAQAFDATNVQRTIEHLASPTYAGRLPGSAEAEAVAHWIAAQMQAAGLRPAASDGSFFQPVAVTYRDLAAMPRLQVARTGDKAAVSPVYLDGFRELQGHSIGSGQADGQLVWLPIAATARG